MRSLRLLSTLAVLLLGTGCVIKNDGGSAPLPGDLDVLWTFGDGRTCFDLGGYVDHVVVQIPGQALQNAGVFGCQVGGVQGIHLSNFSGGDYAVTVDAVDRFGVSLYRGTSSVRIDGSRSVSLILSSTSQGGGYGAVQLRFGFLDAMRRRLSCAQAGVGQVQVQIDNAAPAWVPCSVNGVDGADFVNLSVGQHLFTLTGLTGSGAQATASYSWQQMVVVQPATLLVPVDMAPLNGSWSLGYNFLNATCLTSGVASLAVQVFDARGTDISGLSPGQRISCTDGAKLEWAAFPGGNVTIQMRGFTAGGVPTWGVVAATTIFAGAANDTTVTLLTCGSPNAGC